MSAEATAHVWKHSPYLGAELLVHLAIGDVVNDLHDHEFWMSTYALSKKARVSRTTVVTGLGKMVKDGYLDRLDSGKQDRIPSRYRFLFTRPATGLGLGQSAEGTRPISEESLGQSPVTELNRDNPITQERVSDFPKTQPPWLAEGITRDEWLHR